MYSYKYMMLKVLVLSTAGTTLLFKQLVFLKTIIGLFGTHVRDAKTSDFDNSVLHIRVRHWPGTCVRCPETLKTFKMSKYFLKNRAETECNGTAEITIKKES